MKTLWLSIITATCLLFGTAAHAGDHHRGYYNDRHDYRHCDDRRDWDRGRHEGWRGNYREVYYRPVPVHYRPVYYRPAPRYYERVGGYRDGDIHGSITVGF
jgi:Ni/Co efflux regulator RcnB